jgi:NDP-sugar pyrophosphorylase family protein
MKKKISITLNERTITEIDSIIDKIYIRNRSQAIEHLVNNALGENKTAVILSGGAEKKISISKNEFRPTAMIRDKSVIELAIKKLRESGFKTIFIVARPLVLTKIFEIMRDGSDYGVKINYIEEKESKGTGNSLKLLKGKINSNFLVIYGDIIFNKINIEEFWKSHLKQQSIATLMLTTSPKPSEKGTVKMEGNQVLEFTQKPKQSDIYLVFSAIFAAEPEILDYSGNVLESDIFPALAKKGLLQGHLSSEKEIHIHSKDDINRFS